MHRGYSDILYIRRLGLFWGVHNCEFKYVLRFSEKINILGYEYFVDMFWGVTTNWTIFRGHLYAF